MRGRVFSFWVALNSSYWFVPSLMVVLATALGIFMVWLDAHLGLDWLSHQIGWFQSIKPAGARSVLSAIAGTMITLAGTVFSITIAAITFASGQFGPRLLTNFMSDRGNTVTLGTFVGTSVYCLIVLRTIRAEEDGAGFVPQLAVSVGILLAFASIGVLIYFINHVPRAIHINTVIAGIGQQLINSVNERFPKAIGKPARPPEDRSEPLERHTDRTGPGRAIVATETGYIQSIEEEDLLAGAVQHDLLLRLRYRPGDFVACGRPLLDAWPAASVGEDACVNLRQAFMIGSERTPLGDLNFLVDELVEIAGRALSPGVNDPMTAMTCLDWLGAGHSEIAMRDPPDPARRGADGQVRVIAFPDSFARFVHLSVGRLNQYCARDSVAAHHVLRTIGIVAAACCSSDQLHALETERERLTELVRKHLSGAPLRSFEQLSGELRDLLARGPGRIDEREVDWLGGSG